MATDLIDESVLADARKVDDFVKSHGPDLPSVENTLRLIRDIDTDVLRRIARDVWGTGGEEGADLVGTSFTECVERLDAANKQSSAWTGDANNAYVQRVDQIKAAIDGKDGQGGMRKPSVDVGQALVGLADGWDQIFGSGTVGEILTYLGVALSAIGLAVSFGLDATVVGIPVGVVVGILSLLVGVASVWWGMHSAEEAKVDKAEEAIREATETMRAAKKAKP